ncbi:hypothetical protein JOS77_02645 [Chromobacterium haemolyticum]|nr:hypothetical protein JOS77_02645 [Chromobacterium haemolyticum]
MNSTLLKADEDAFAHGAGAVNDGAVGDGGVRAYGDGGAALGVDDHAVLDIGVGADDDGFHLAVGVHFVGADHRVGADEDIVVDDDLAAEDGGLVDVGGFGDQRQVAGGVLAYHALLSEGVFTIYCAVAIRR